MFTALFALIALAAQAIPILPSDAGSITGVIRNAAGNPAPGVRVGAIAVESATDVATASAMVSIAETDERGRYLLEKIPPGRYYIAAGRVDLPTYYPGTIAFTGARVVSVTSRATVNGIDFAMQDSSVRGPFDPFGSLASSLSSLMTFVVPVHVTVESSDRFPVFSPAGFSFIRLTSVANGVRTEVPVNAASIRLSSSVGEFRVSVQNIPPGYGVKKIMAGQTDITNGSLKLSSSDFPALAAFNAGLNQGVFVVAGVMTASVNVSITLTAATTAPATAGVRITGKANDASRRSVFISGQPGTFYSDGSFEFRGVPPGRHIIVTPDNPESGRTLAASIVVGNQDIEGVELVETSVLPPAIRNVSGPLPAGTHPVGAVPLASLHVAVSDEATHQPVSPGTVYILGGYGTSFDLPENGRFDLSRLLPGEYKFEIRPFGRASITRTVEIGDEDVSLELTVQ